eukprot:TRINITY_DN17306_c0_g1_i1.p1 TRINITY_DN17306_c0_g1~~TRINITY_DN17306_c0_g1_i1.p1  ORF type:complete len:1578 (-),score=323.38 TRINITY_DN17306_c0_g1_i1:79-4812(-)
MGGQFSQLIIDSSRDKEGEEFFIENQKLSSKELPTYVDGLARQLPNLTILDIKSCRLKAVPPAISKITSLQTLRLEENRIATLPTVEWATMKNLRELNLARNQIIRFPVESIKHIESLQTCIMTANQLSTLPPLDSLTSLRHLQLDANDFSAFPPQLCDLTAIRILNLSSNKISTISDQISRLISLEELNLRRNMIRTIPPQIGKLSNLRILDVAENELSFLPEEAKGLVSLRSLLCQHNNFTEIPQAVYGLPNLSHLRFSGNKLTSLSPDIKNATKLTELHLEENDISSLPLELCQVSTLRKLCLEFNRIEALPEEIGNLKLNVLLLHNNRIKTLPQSLIELKTLIRFSIDENLLDDESTATVKRDGALALLNIFDHIRGRNLRKSSMSSNRSFRKSSLANSREDLVKDVPPSSSPPQLIHKESMPNIPSLSMSPKESSKNPRVMTRRLTIEKIKSTQSEEQIISPRRGKKIEKKTDCPPIERFKEYFRLISDQQDFSKKRKEALKKATPEYKWQLLQQYKDSTLELIKYSTTSVAPSSKEQGGSAIKSKSRERTYQEYINVIKERPNRVDLIQLRNLIANHKPDHSWTSFFVDSGGIAALSSLLSSLLTRGIKANQLIIETLKLIQTLLDICFKSVLTTNEIFENIGFQLNNPQAEIRRLIIDIFIQICQEHPVGVNLVLESISSHATSQSLHTMYRFDPIVQPLQDDSSLTGLDTSNNDLRTSSLTLINTIIDLIDDLEERFEIRAEFLRLGIQEHLDRLKNSNNSELAYQVKLFESSGKEDYEDMLGRFDRKTILRKMTAGLSTDMSKYTIGNNMLRVSVFLLGAQNHFSMQFTKHTTVDEVVRNIHTKYSLPLLSVDFGIFVPSTDSDQSRFGYLPQNTGGMWLNDYALIDSYSFSSELLSDMELKLKPWRISVLSPGQEKRKEFIDSNCTCAAITRAIMEKDRAGSHSEEFGLYIHVKDQANDAWRQKLTDDSKYLSDYYTYFVKKSGKNSRYINVLTVKLKPRQLKVRMVDNSIHIFDLELDSLIRDVFGVISNKIGISSINITDYGLKLSNLNRNEDVWLDNDSPLGQQFLDEESEIRLVFRPKKLTIINEETKEEISDFFDFTIPIVDILGLIANSFKTQPPNFSANEYCLSFSEGRILNNNQSLRSQGVSANSNLSFQKRIGTEDIDINIWDEVEGPNNLVMSEQEGSGKTIEEATLNILVQRLTSLDEIDTTTRYVFLMTYRAFCTQKQLLEKLIQRYNIPPSQEKNFEKKKIQMRVGIFLKNWIENEEITPEIKGTFYQFVDTLVADGYTTLVKSIQKNLASPRREEPKKVPLTQTQTLSLNTIDEVDLAHQLTLKAYEIYKKIDASEFFGQAWSKPHTMHLSPNLINLIDLFNQVSLWVATSILAERTIKGRTNAVIKLVKAATILREIKNFHLLQAFVSGMNLSAVLRLKWTFARLPKRYKLTLSEIEKEMSVEGSFKLYRLALQKVQPANACIPYLGVYLQDLIFIEDGNPDHLQNRINFTKFRQVYDVVTCVQRYQANPYPYPEADAIQALLSPLAAQDERTLYEISLQCEPRGADSSDIL